MMYNNKLVASLKANGKILREFKDTVYIPFGSEYSFLIKNLNTTRAVVNIFIDGEDVVEGGLVVNAGQEVDLERYVKHGNLKAGNKFKFIERSGAVEEHRGIKLEDGLVRVEFQFERPPMRVIDLPDWQKKQIWDGIKYGTINASGSTGASEYPRTTDKFSVQGAGSANASTTSININGMLRGVDFSNGESVKAQASAAINNYCVQNNISASVGEIHDGIATMDSYNDVGITVPGSKSTQSFTTVSMGQMEPEKHSIVLKLLGETPDNKPVLKPVTVKAKPKCVTCGKQNKATAKFCAECGTALEIFA